MQLSEILTASRKRLQTPLNVDGKGIDSIGPGLPTGWSPQTWGHQRGVADKFGFSGFVQFFCLIEIPTVRVVIFFSDAPAGVPTNVIRRLVFLILGFLDQLSCTPLPDTLHNLTWQNSGLSTNLTILR